MTQKQLLTLLMKPTTKDLSRLSVREDFHLRVENARQNYSMHPKKEDKEDLPISAFNACFADGGLKKANGNGDE